MRHTCCTCIVDVRLFDIEVFGRVIGAYMPVVRDPECPNPCRNCDATARACERTMQDCCCECLHEDETEVGTHGYKG